MSFWIWCFGCIGCIVMVYLETMDRKNLIRIEPPVMSYKGTEVVGKYNQAFRECICVQESNVNGIEYSHDKLYSIVRKVSKDPRYKLIGRSACTRISKLHLNKRGKRLKHHTHRLGLIPEGVNSSNLIRIKMDANQSIRDLKLNLTLSLLNAQSIKNKELILHGQLTHHDVDICILTETWLSDNDLDRTWLQYTVLNKVPYQMLTSNRKGRKGGGVALIAKSHLRVKQIGEDQLRSFQFCKWQVQVHQTSITQVSIYHLPYNNKTKVTNAEFLDEYTDWIAETSANEKNLVICGDYNMHVNNPHDEDAASFLETNEALGLKQHVTFATHT